MNGTYCDDLVNECRFLSDYLSHWQHSEVAVGSMPPRQELLPLMGPPLHDGGHGLAASARLEIEATATIAVARTVLMFILTEFGGLTCAIYGGMQNDPFAGAAQALKALSQRGDSAIGSFIVPYNGVE